MSSVVESRQQSPCYFFVANKGDIPSFRDYFIVTPNLVIVTPFLDSSRDHGAHLPVYAVVSVEFESSLKTILDEFKNNTKIV